MISAEAAGYATGAAMLGDGLARREIDHVERIDVAGAVKNRRREMASVDLGQKLSLNVGVVDGRAIVA